MPERSLTRSRLVRFGLWFLNVPFGLIALYLGFYAVAGLWDPDISLAIRAFTAVQPCIAVIAWLVSSDKWNKGQSRTANLLLTLPPASVILLLLILQLRRL